MSDSGTIRLEGNVIRYRSTVYGDWGMPISDLRVLGECTNQDGPFADDYFICFASGPGMWLEASFYAEGCDRFLQELGAALGCKLEPGLCHSTDFASRVLWPGSLEGQPMFKYEDLPAKTLLGRLVGVPRNLQTYSVAVAATLAGDD